MISRIVIAIDGSEAAKRAVDFGVELAKKMDAKIDIVTVIQYPTITYYDSDQSFYDSLMKRMTDSASAKLDEAAAVVKDAEIAVDTHVFQGDARFVLADQVPEQLNPDLLVLGKTGTNIVMRVFMGSTARYVSEHADASVLLVK
ncbi:universal stress protein family [Leuconostoc litchii]|uniref:Universal stress protein n=1 Tax=Leuconostoc litchii TaxID=1981069 RepID=A0A6P2CP93_9LACO|nr:universal stress protein [Leuconostoc litchii]TYC46801.1 universal stress protein [Leuconostoc litchii]GMA70691.1 universal stress protein family [Leuconostoc litchii]